MMRVLHDAAAIALVADQTHLVGVAFIFQGGAVRRKVREVGRVTGCALGLSLAVTSRPHESFHDECRLTEAPILVKRPMGINIVGAAQGSFDETEAFGGKIHFSPQTNPADRALTMTLPADPDAGPIIELPKGHGRIERSLGDRLLLPHFFDVQLTGAMAHFAIDAGFAKRCVLQGMIAN